MSIEDTLAKVELFRDIERNDLESLAKVVVTRSFKAGATIVKEGEPGLAFYIIATGQVEVAKGSQVLTTLGAGDFFGEMALFDDSPRSASVKAVTDTECLVMSKWDLKTVFTATEGRVAFALLAVLARRVRNLTDAATH